MISSLVFCRAMMDGYVPVSNGYLLFSALSHRIAAVDSSQLLHQEKHLFCCSALLPEFFWQTLRCSSSNGKIHFNKKDIFAFRISFLDDNHYFIFKKAEGFFKPIASAFLVS